MRAAFVYQLARNKVGIARLQISSHRTVARSPRFLPASAGPMPPRGGILRSLVASCGAHPCLSQTASPSACNGTLCNATLWGGIGVAGTTFQVLVGGAALTVVLALLASVGVKYFARPLPYSTAFLISLAGFAVCTVLYLLYFTIQTAMGFPRSFDGLFGLVAMSVAGTIITRLARTYGVEKTGWLGIGAKSIFVLVGLSWVVVVIVYLGMQAT